jgi:LysM repeat protein
MPEKAMKHNDVYVDDAELVVVDGATAFSPPAAAPNSAPAPQPAVNVPAGPAPTALPRPDGALVHIVQSGDTVFGLALQYDVPMDSILQLNGLTKESYLLIGQELVIAPGKSSAVQPTTAPVAAVSPTAPAPTVAVTPTPAQIAAVSKTQLCVSAFSDSNGDGVLSGGESLADGAIFNVTNDQDQLVLSYMTDGQSEPHCFTRLKPGKFDIQIEPAAGTVATSDRRWSITLEPGATINVNFGSRASTTAAATTTSPSSPGDGSAAIGLAFLVIIAAAGWLIYRHQRTGARV